MGWSTKFFDTRRQFSCLKQLATLAFQIYVLMFYYVSVFPLKYATGGLAHNKTEQPLLSSFFLITIFLIQYLRHLRIYI